VDKHSTIKMGNAAAAEESLRYHLTEILSTMPDIAKAHADLFEDVSEQRHSTSTDK
jgi:hypothetical protein